jgi:hypothetical protein
MTEETPTQEGTEASYILGKNLALDMLTDLYKQAQPLRGTPAACIAGALEMLLACTFASAPTEASANEMIEMATENAKEHNKDITAADVAGERVH